MECTCLLTVPGKEVPGAPLRSMQSPPAWAVLKKSFTLGLAAWKSSVSNRGLHPIEFKSLESLVQFSLFHLPFLSFIKPVVGREGPGMYLLYFVINMHRLEMLREPVLGRPVVQPTRAFWSVRQAWFPDLDHSSGLASDTLAERRRSSHSPEPKAYSEGRQ